MNAHSETCSSGDHTLDATRRAILEITKEEADEYFVVLLSDANLEQYSIRPSDLQALLDLDERVNLFILFIGSSQSARASRLCACQIPRLPVSRLAAPFRHQQWGCRQSGSRRSCQRTVCSSRCRRRRSLKFSSEYFSPPSSRRRDLTNWRCGDCVPRAPRERERVPCVLL